MTNEAVTRNMGTTVYRAAVGVALLTTVLLVWVNFVQMADDVNPAAFRYFVVPLVGSGRIGSTESNKNGDRFKECF